jgi:DNA-binding HxlR family transcriptional regulator
MPKRTERQRLRACSFLRSDCPLACSLDVVGDKWTLLIVRDLFFGRARYGQFLEAGEGIPTNVLAQRLRRLVEAGLVEKARTRSFPPFTTYKLTRTGRTLGPILRAIEAWGSAQIPGTRGRKKRR